VTSIARSRAAPEVPTVAEAVPLPGFRASTWYALLAPARTPPPVVAKLHGAVKQALQSPAVTEQLLAQGAETIVNTPDELKQFLKTEIDVWTKVIRQANVRPSN
jgi:tripartite-type tricarboxylate transporter receptor subunit TctC